MESLMVDYPSRVLFLDDEPAMLSALKRTLRTEPYHRSFALSGAEAFRMLDQEPADVVVTDMHMPGMAGEEVLQRLESRFPDTVRLILSAHGDGDTVLRAVNAGRVYRYITKPWDNRELKIIIRQALEYALIQKEKKALLNRLKSQNRELEDKVERRSRQLLDIQGQAEIGKYASQIVHNLKNPLHAVFGALGLTEMAIDKGPEVDISKLKNLVQLARKAANQLHLIIGGVLTHARTGRPFQLETVDVNSVIKAFCRFYK